MLEHGGRLRKAAKQFGIALENWTDLSTGINPESYPIGIVPMTAWHRLPETDDQLNFVASQYYGNENLLAVAGSQAVIQCLPSLRQASSRVAILTPSYNEHHHAWKSAGGQMVEVEASSLEIAISKIEQCIDELDVLLLCSPNNPTGITFPPELLQRWWQNLSSREGWLIVDEAFMDVTPELSMTPHCGQRGLIVLRSLGKFFGLAGARVGFVFASPSLLTSLADKLGPWTVSGPSRVAAIRALSDFAWQNDTKQKLLAKSMRLSNLLRDQGLPVSGGSSFFSWIKTPDAESLHKFLCERGILTRLFTTPASLRFGLPESEKDWEKLSFSIEEWNRQLIMSC